MKHIARLFGIIALAAIIGFLMTACDDGNGEDIGSDINNGSGALGATLNLSGQVYTWFDWGDIGGFEIFTGNLGVHSDGFGGTGSVTNGQLNFSIGRPARLFSILYLFQEMEAEGLNNFRFNPAEAQCAMLGLLTIPDGSIGRGNAVLNSITANGRSDTMHLGSYIYVDRDVNFSADLTQSNYHDRYYTVNAFNINLKAGWNALYGEETRIIEYTEAGTILNYIITYSTASPGGLRWVFQDWSDW